MSNAMDKLKLIAEVRKRPAIWDFKCKEHKSLRILQKAWIDVVVAMGSNVDECKSTWKNLRDAYRVRVKKSELDIARDKLNGSYDPSNDYSSKWAYYEHMKFVNDINKQSPMNLRNENNSDDNDSNQVSKVHNMDNTKMKPDRDLEMSNAMDILKLIAEVRKRPALWDIKSEEHKSKIIHQQAWKDLIVAMGSNVTVKDCRRKWRSLRSTNRAVVNRIELRIQEAKQKGAYNPNNDYSSEWPYFEHMKFMNDIKKPPVNDHKSDLEMANRFKLIAEIRKRPALWDIKSKDQSSQRIRQKSWKDLAVAMGSDVNECRRIWKNLRTTNQVTVNKIESRIKEAKLNGSYNSNKKKISSNWPYFEAMKFLKDKLQLIVEVRNRPELWDFQSKEHRSCLSAAEVWKELAVSLGSDVETCQRNWISLCRSYNRSVTRLKYRIQEAKQKGSYNPNNDYSSQWPYFEHMDFMKDNTNNSIKLLNRNSGDKFKLIAEVRKRPELWCIKSKEYMPRLALQKIWEDLAQAMGAEVDDCKRKWTSLLQGYRLEVKKLELRIKEDKLNGSYNQKKEYRSKWIFYERMKFCDDIKNPSLMELENTFVNDNNSDDNDSNQVSKFQNNKMKPQLDLEPEVYLPDDEDSSPETPVGVKSNFSGLNLPENQEPADDKPTTSHWKSAKGEPGLDLDPEVYIPDDEDYDTDSQMSDIEFISEQNSPSNQESANDKPSSTCVLSANVELELDLDREVYIIDDEDYDTDSQMSSMEFLSDPNSPQNLESADDKPSSTGVLLVDIEKEEHNLTKSADVYILDNEDDDTDSQMSGIEFLSEPNSPQNQEPADDKPSSTGGNCTKRPYDQANCLEDLGKDEHNLIKLVRSNEMVPVADSDYNFLVSFLPKMKKFNELKNLQFRAKMTDLMLDIEKE